MHTLDLCRARSDDISSTSQPQQWHKAIGKKNNWTTCEQCGGSQGQSQPQAETHHVQLYPQ